jgi:hypothetical protein
VKAFEAYLASDGFEKAFAVGARGGWGRSFEERTMTDAMWVAVEFCKASGDRSCIPYAVGNEYAPGVTDRLFRVSGGSGQRMRVSGVSSRV